MTSDDGSGRHTSRDLAEHLNAAKIASMSTTERLDVMEQVLAAPTVNLSTLGRCGCPCAQPLGSSLFPDLLICHITVQPSDKSQLDSGCIEAWTIAMSEWGLRAAGWRAQGCNLVHTSAHGRGSSCLAICLRSATLGCQHSRSDGQSTPRSVKTSCSI